MISFAGGYPALEFLRLKGTSTRRWLKVSGALVIVAAAAFSFANWKFSPLHVRVCGPNNSQNLRWLVNGRRANGSGTGRVAVFARWTLGIERAAESSHESAGQRDRCIDEPTSCCAGRLLLAACRSGGFLRGASPVIGQQVPGPLSRKAV